MPVDRHGNYLRTGRLTASSEVDGSCTEFAADGGLATALHWFQILCEADACYPGAANAESNTFPEARDIAGQHEYALHAA